MVALIPFTQAALAVLLASSSSAHAALEAIIPNSELVAQPTPIMPMFLLDSAPLSLHASIVAVRAVSTEPSQRIVTYALDCPPPASPNNDACRALSIYPAEVWHTRGSVYGGTTTAAADDSTTVWKCDLGSGVSAGSSIGPVCVKSIAVPGKPASAVTTELDKCYVEAHSVPLLVTAGAEKLPKGALLTLVGGFGGAVMWNSGRDSSLAAMGCAVTSTATTAPSSASATTTGRAADTARTTEVTAAQSRSSETPASPSATTTSEAPCAFVAPWMLVAVAAVASVLY